MYQSIRPQGPLDDAGPTEGHALETLVMQQLRAWIDYSCKEGKLYFWRTRKGLEVDFIIYGEIGFYAFEVKNSSTVKPKDLKGLYEFQKDYPEATCIFLYRGRERVMKNKVLCIPIDKFLLSLEPNQDID